ncbi:MAG TPA: SDR family NAD(P)-dependent oxidoreductase [Kofleriaceae bacterium]|nr:SDR family NAD(P)-dependent oxidoreductase [Kofleriaceae bacterium]
MFVVTGAGRGIGLELTAQWLARGDRVIATYRDDRGKARLEALGAAGGDLRLAQLDVRNAGSVAALAAELDGAPIDVLVNNAGVMGTSAPSLADMDHEEWLETFVVNVQRPYRVTTALLPSLRAGTRGSCTRSTPRPGASSIPLPSRSTADAPDDDELYSRVAELRDQHREISRLGMPWHRVSWRDIAPSGKPTSVDPMAIAEARARSTYGPRRRWPHAPQNRGLR